MKRVCSRCNYEINSKYILKQESAKEIICPNCGRKLKATEASKIVCVSIFVIIVVFTICLPINYFKLLIVIEIWIYVYKRFLPAYIYQYEEKE